MEIILPKEIYSKEAIIKTTYLFHDNFTINFAFNDISYILTINSLNKAIFDKADFLSKLQEQQLREFLNEQSGKLREAIYQKAFSLVE